MRRFIAHLADVAAIIGGILLVFAAVKIMPEWALLPFIALNIAFLGWLFGSAVVSGVREEIEHRQQRRNDPLWQRVHGRGRLSSK